jgi:CheY-like chemotaxis protein
VQILTNLVNNGIKYTDQGAISITIENCGYDSGNTLRLRFIVKDTGCGIAQEKLELISHYFKQKATPNISMPLSVGTTGLGLTVSSQLVKLMGGEIGVESGSGGSTFWFELPFKEVADILSLEEKANTTLENITETDTFTLKGAKVLLAEDEHINRTLIETILKQLGVHVTAVDNGQAAVKEACSGAYKMVLMDVQMEGMDGLEATRAIRKHERKHGGHLNIVALTALAMPGDREKCLQAGMDDYLPKPIEKNQLIEVLIKFLTKRALVMDSDPITQSMLVRTLIESGWQVILAETRRSAMYEASLSHFDLILLDVSTPHLESMKVAKLIRQLEEYSGQRAKIIGVDDEGKLSDLRGCGFDGSMVRPVTRDKILQHINAPASII